MKKQLSMSVFTLAIVTALIGGATMAWFSDAAVSDNASFQAGTLLIEANSSLIYGVEQETGDLFEIDPTTGMKYRIYATPNFSGTNENSPNGLAYDNKNHRLYFAVYYDENSQTANSTLFFYDFAGKHHEAGEAVGVVAGACYGRGYFWYIRNGTDDLYKVSFHPNGMVNEVILAYPSFTRDAKTFRFGDVAMESYGNILYGSSLQSGTTLPEFFKIDLNTGDYAPIPIGGSSSGLQLAFGANGVLYGHSTGSGQWHSIDTTTGVASELTIWSPGKHRFTDLASNWQNNWNPGDCDMARFYVRNTGTKNSFIRFNWSASFWGFDPQVSDVVSIEPCDNSWVVNPDNPEDGFIYYQGELSPNKEILLCIKVCLSGEVTGNEYQGQVFKLKPVFEAIQVTHNASDDWGWPGPLD